MLSVGKLAAGQECYYERTVAHGQDDYYSGKGEAPGRWIGRGAEQLGLDGQVRAEQLSAMAAGIDPSDPGLHRALRSSRSEVRVAGYDLTFSAPKSVSVLFAVADPETSRELVRAHDAAVGAALRYVEDTAVKVRRGKGGVVVQPGGGLVAAAYRHRLSRSLDPQLHTHVVAVNASQGPDGRWTALDARHIYRHAKTAGTLYQAHLRAEVRDRLGLEWGAVSKGAAELVGVPKGVRDHFSRRRMEMLEQAEGDGFSLNTKGRAESAALATRSRKTYEVDTVTWREEVVARAAEHGLDREAIEALVDEGRKDLSRGVRIGGPPVDFAALDARLAGPTGLTEMANTFFARDAVREYAEAHQQGARVVDVRDQAREFLRREDVRDVQLSDELDRPGEQDRLFTTDDLVATERRLVATAAGRAGEGVARLSDRHVDRALATSDRTLSDEQTAAVRVVAGSGNGVDVVEALAGTGKTYTAGVLRQTYESAGLHVVGVAPTGRAVRELADEAGITGSRTLHSMIAAIEREPKAKLADVVILDEAAMASTRQTERMLRWAEDRGVKVIAIGDPGQLPSVQAGGWMRAVGERVGHHRLDQVRRQRDPDERRALGQLHEGHSVPYLEWADQAGRVTVHDLPRNGMDRAVAAWASAVDDHGLASAVLIARDNDARRALNDRAREVRRDLGGLGVDHDYGPVTVAAGDRIICRRNNWELDVDNGTRGTVQSATEDGITLRTDTGAARELPADYVAGHVEPAYALTGHGMQGGTVEWAAVVAEPWELTRGWSYTALSRARDATELHVVAPHDDDDEHRDEIAPSYRPPRATRTEILDQVAQRMTVRDDEDLAVDRLAEPDERRLPNPPDVLAPTSAPPARDVSTNPDPPDLADRQRIAGLLDEQSRLQEQRRAFPTHDLRAYEDAASRLHRVQTQRASLVKRLQSLPDPRKRFLRAPADEHTAERNTLRGAIAGADTAIREAEARRDVAAHRLPGDPTTLRRDFDDLDNELRGITSRVERGLNAVADREVRWQPRWATRQLGPRPSDYALAEEWDHAARGIAKHELRYRPREPVSGLSAEQPADADEGRGWARAARTVHVVREAIERGPEPPGHGADLGW
ncbi:MobF family relaxase [Patulibacter sp. NPDC049589]|uniref:MobF family relaxase n=1 Tax=Patulibacter sp. NPDC049589 TaxID=3154731 RepID=UPI0034409A94